MDCSMRFSSLMSAKIALLRKEESSCPFRTLLEQNQFNVSNIELYRTVFINQRELCTMLQSPAMYSGLIITSQKAAEAISNCRQVIEIDPSWLKLVIYTVGPATARACSNLGFQVAGEQSNCAQKLCDFILEQMKPNDALLFLVGDKTCDTIMKLENVHSMPVYQTEFMDDNMFIDGFEYVVFFSPSAVKRVTTKSICVAIGARTAKALTSKGNVCTAALKPTPLGILEAIQMSRLSTGGS